MTLQLQTDVTRSYTNEEFEALPEFDGRYELLDGKVVEKMPNGDRHGRISHRLERLITLFDPDEKLGLTWRETSFSIAAGFEPMPDLAFVIASRVPAETSKAIEVVPDLVVEVHSPHDLETKNRQIEAETKIRKYQTAGVRAVWAINPDKRTVEIYQPEQARPVQILGVAEVLDASAIIPGFKLRVADLFGL